MGPGSPALLQKTHKRKWEKKLHTIRNHCIPEEGATKGNKLYDSKKKNPKEGLTKKTVIEKETPKIIKKSPLYNLNQRRKQTQKTIE